MSQSDLNIAILGAGLAGLSTSYHLGHPEDAVILEAKDHYGGHVYSEQRDGFTWDDGPHISFTMNQYVKDLFAECVDRRVRGAPDQGGQLLPGHWIDHPAQTCLYQVPEPLRTQCLESFLETARSRARAAEELRGVAAPGDGPGVRRHLPGGVHTQVLDHATPRTSTSTGSGSASCDPKVDDVVNGAKGPLPPEMYYVEDRSPRTRRRAASCPYCHKMADGADIRYGTKIDQVDFGKRMLRLRGWQRAELRAARLHHPAAVPHQCSIDAPDDVREAAALLRSSQFYRIDVAVNHPRRRDEIWYYIYDEDKLSVRLSLMERFSPSNAPEGQDRAPGRGLRIGVEAAAARPRKVKQQVIERAARDGPHRRPGRDRVGPLRAGAHRPDHLRPEAPRGVAPRQRLPRPAWACSASAGTPSGST